MGNNILSTSFFFGESPNKQIAELADQVNSLQLKINTKLDVSSSSYQAFVSGATGTVLDAAFGSGNEDNIYGVGKALMLYAQYKGEPASNFTNLCQIDNLNQLTYESCVEILDSASLLELFNKTAYAYQPLFDEYLSTALIDGKLEKLEKYCSYNSIIKANDYAYNLMTSRMTVLTESGTWTAPADKEYIIVCAIGGGGSGAVGMEKRDSYGIGIGGAGSGYFNQQILQLSSNEVIEYEIGTGGAQKTWNSMYSCSNGGDGGSTIFKSIVVEGGKGAQASIAKNGVWVAGALGGAKGGDSYGSSLNGGKIDDINLLIKSMSGTGYDGSPAYWCTGGSAGGLLNVKLSGDGSASSKAYIKTSGGIGYGAGGGSSTGSTTSNSNVVYSGAGAPGAIFIFN